MSTLAESGTVTRLLGHLSQAGRAGGELAVRLDVLRAVGPAAAVRRMRYDARLRTLQSASAANSYKEIWTDAARELGAELVEQPGGFLEIRRDGAWTRVLENLVMLDDAVTLRFGLQKTLISELLRRSGLPVPDWLEFDSADPAPARRFLVDGPVPCVVKPVASSSGYAVTSGINSEEELLRALIRAARVGRRLMIERQAQGDFYRLLVLDGRVLDVVRRHPPRVTGDGRSSVEELIAAENERRFARRHEAILWPLRVDLECVLTLRDQGLTLGSVPPANTTIPVKTIVSQGTGQDNETIRAGVCAELEQAAIRAAELVGLRLAGVDVITPDVGKPLAAAGGVVLEVNGPPGLSYHYDVADAAQATRVAVPILRTLLEEGSRART